MVVEDQFKNYCIIKTFGLKRSDIAPYLRTGNVSVDYSEECLDGTIRVLNNDAEETEFPETLDVIKRAFKDRIYSDCDSSLAKKLVDTCRENGIRLIVAESITGGMICSSLVDIPGASEVLTEGLVTYTDAAKVRRLHVRLSTLEKFGAISKETAGEMAHGLLENRDVDLGIATTGCAGPDSDEKGTPVGLSFVGIATRKGGVIYRLNLTGDRNYIRRCVANAAMFYALKSAENGDKEN